MSSSDNSTDGDSSPKKLHAPKPSEVSDPTGQVEREIAEKIERWLPPGPIEPRQLAEALAEFVSIEVRTSFQGPLPPPQTLSEYEKAIPGLAGRIVDRSDKEQAFRHEMTREGLAQSRLEIAYAGNSRYVGQFIGFAIAMLSIGGGIWLISNGLAVGGLVAIISALASLVVVFVAGKAADAYTASKSAQSQDDDSSDE